MTNLDRRADVRFGHSGFALLSSFVIRHCPTMFNLKPLHPEAIPQALEKAMRYRLLNEPGEAESICLDVLRIDPENQQALVSLLLAITDRFGKGYAVGASQEQEVLARIKDPYERAYYAGIISERRQGPAQSGISRSQV